MNKKKRDRERFEFGGDKIEKINRQMSEKRKIGGKQSVWHLFRPDLRFFHRKSAKSTCNRYKHKKNDVQFVCLHFFCVSKSEKCNSSIVVW